MFKFIHTADIHLDSPLRTLALKDPDAAELIANATRQSFEQTVELCISERVDAFLIAGDLYDGELTSMKTAQFFTRQMYRLETAGIPVFIIRGNHDAESRITRHLVLPDNVHVFSGRGEAVPVPGHEVVIHGVSFADPKAPHSLLPDYGAPVPGKLNIGMLHTSLSGAEGHDDYAPCSLADLINQGFDYWALGHVHKREIHADQPCAIVMPGIPQGRHINEAGPKSVTLAELSPDGTAHIEARSTALVEFARARVDLTGIEDWTEGVRAVEAALDGLGEGLSARHGVLRLDLTGQSTLANRLRRDRDLALMEMREAAARAGPLFVEQLDISCTSQPVETKTRAGDPVGELATLMAGSGADALPVREATHGLLLELQKRLPPELRDGFDPDKDAHLIEHYLETGRADILARLAGNGGQDA